jgi:hypothetical protein
MLIVGSPNSSTSEPADSGGLSPGAIGGIVGGVVGFLLLVAIAVAFIVVRRKRKNPAESTKKALGNVVMGRSKAPGSESREDLVEMDEVWKSGGWTRVN